MCVLVHGTLNHTVRDYGKMSFNSLDTEWLLNVFLASHSCFLCRRPSKFKCFCCPKAVCGNCYAAEFALVKGNKGFCQHCSKLALLIEENADADSDGVRFSFNHVLYAARERDKKLKTCNSIWNPKFKNKITNYYLFVPYVYLQIEIFWHE